MKCIRHEARQLQGIRFPHLIVITCGSCLLVESRAGGKSNTARRTVFLSKNHVEVAEFSPKLYAYGITSNILPILPIIIMSDNNVVISVNVESRCFTFVSDF